MPRSNRLAFPDPATCFTHEGCGVQEYAFGNTDGLGDPDL